MKRSKSARTAVTRFPTDNVLNTMLSTFSDKINSILEEDTEQAHIEAAQAYMDITPMLLPDEYRNLTDAWSNLNQAVNAATMNEFDEVLESISYRAVNGRYPA
jgi:hypothetical protein